MRSAALVIWWAPAVALAIAGYVIRAAAMEVRLRRVDRLLKARRVEEAGRVLKRLRAEMGAPR